MISYLTAHIHLFPLFCQPAKTERELQYCHKLNTTVRKRKKAHLLANALFGARTQPSDNHVIMRNLCAALVARQSQGHVKIL
jgi:hypothetical protein